LFGIAFFILLSSLSFLGVHSGMYVCPL
jgi:hypothetical protein